MARKKRKLKHRVPDILWRVYGNRARTLSQTILSLLPPPSSCRCKRRRSCICCSGSGASSFLVRPRDPHRYKKLLNRCYVVVDANAPKLHEFSPDSHWSQQQIVSRTIEMMICKDRRSSNVLCSGYDQRKSSSPYLELLTCPAWSLLLTRVGDALVVYLLKYTSFFLPFPNKSLQQVAGFPINKLFQDLTKRSAEIHHEHSSPGHGPQKKRRKVHTANPELDVEQSHIPLNAGVPSNYVGCVGCHSQSTLRSCIWQMRKDLCLDCSSHMVLPGATSITNAANDLNGKLQSNLNWNRKRSRPFKWHRISKPSNTICCTTSGSNGGFTGRLVCNHKSSLGSLNQNVPLTCSCCLMFSFPVPPIRRVHIDRKCIFYNLEHASSALPKRNVLNSLLPNMSNSNVLFRNIFGESGIKAGPQPCIHSSKICLVGSACLYHSVIKLLKILIRRVMFCCDHIKLINKHCSGTSLDQHCSPSQVVSFIWAVCRSVVPADLLGNTHNRRTLRENIYKFIQLQKFEKFSLKQCLHKLKTSGYSFLSDKHSTCYWNDHIVANAGGKYVPMPDEISKITDSIHIMKCKILEKWVFWLFSSLIVPLVQSNFYVTESQHGRQGVYYFRKSVWEKRTNQAISQLEKESYRLLGDAALRSILGRRSFGFSKLRFLPKEKGVRMLGNFKASSRLPLQMSCADGYPKAVPNRVKFNKQKTRFRYFKSVNSVRFRYFKSVNSVLRDTHIVLKGVLLKEPELLGSSVFDYNNVYRKLCPFVIGLRNILPSPNLYIVVADVSKAFDSIDQDKLLNVMKNVLVNNQYVLKQSSQVVKRNKSLWVDRKLTLLDEDIASVPSQLSHSIFVNQVREKYIKREELLIDLYEHVKHNVLKFGKSFYLQGIGIPQGSILSPLLCSLYYGDLDRNVILPFLERTHEGLCTGQNSHVVSTVQKGNEDRVSLNCNYLLLRFTDDILFISTSKKQASSFFDRLRRGFRDYNCYMNEEKFGLNFDIGNLKGLLTNRVYVGEDGISFLQWSGLLINCCTSEVQADYTRYCLKHIRSTITVLWQGEPGRSLKGKLCAFMRPKCHPIFFDSNINSAAIVRLNIYQAFLLGAMKFHCYIRDLSCACKLSAGNSLHVVRESMRYMYVLIKKRMRCLKSGDCCPVLYLEGEEVEWLGLNAYIRVLKRKQSRHKHLLSLLRLQLEAHRLTGKETLHLKYAIDDIHSSSIWKIKY